MRGPRAKIERAKEQVGQLEAMLGGDLTFAHTTHPNVILREENPETAKQIYKIGAIPKIPDRIAAIAGDVVHNLRSSLDLLIAQLIESSGQTPSGEYFPIAGSRKKFKTRCKTEIEGRVGEDAYNLICATEAYRGGKGDPLWRVHRLDIEDKHRLLFVIGFGFHSLTLTVPTEGLPADFATAIEGMMDELFWQPADRMVPLKEGDELFIDDLPSKTKNEPKFRLDVAFDEVKVVKGEPVIPTLVQLGQVTETTVESFAPLLNAC